MTTSSSNTLVEPVTAALAAAPYPGGSMHDTRVPVTAISLGRASPAQLETDVILAAARLPPSHFLEE